MVTELAFEINGLQLVVIDEFMQIDIRPENQLEHPGTMKALNGRWRWRQCFSWLW